MIILKLNIDPIKLNDLPKCDPSQFEKPQSLIPPFKWYERTYKGGLEEDTIALIGEVSEERYEVFDKSVFYIKDINIENDVPVYLDETKEVRRILKVSRKELEEYAKKLRKLIKELEKKYLQKPSSPKSAASCECTRTERIIGDFIKKLKDKLSSIEDILGKNKREVIVKYYRYLPYGYYTRKGERKEPRNPEVVLLMNNIGDDPASLISTYVHEMFHAYYDLDWLMLSQSNLRLANLKYIWQGSKGYGDLKYIEEPLTEYAMLKFLDEFAENDTERKNILKQAAQAVADQQWNIGSCYYTLGYYLWYWEKVAGKTFCNWIQMYKNLQSKQELWDDKLKPYFNQLKQGLDLYFPGDERHYMALLYKLLMKAGGNPVGDITEIENMINQHKIADCWYDVAVDLSL